MLPSDSLLGLVFALVMYAASVIPSLMPRSWWWHAAASGVLMALGYIAGAVVELVGGILLDLTGAEVTAPETTTHWFQIIVVAAFLLWFVRSVTISRLASIKAARLVHMRAETWVAYILGTITAALFAYLLVELVRSLLWSVVDVAELLERWLPNTVAVIAAVALVVGAVYLFATKIVVGGAVALFSRLAYRMNNQTARGIHQPTVPERSGSPDSVTTWESAGGQGRIFLGRGPHKEDIEAVTGRHAMEPIRVYAGMPKSGDLEESAAQVVEELRRTGAFDRRVLVVSIATGSGWVDEWQVQPVEYLTGGDCATASMQYSYLFSSLNFITGLDLSVKASAALFGAVHRAWSELPESRRPYLYLCGESLGAYGSQSIFRDIDEVLASVDGALWVGTPGFTRMHRELTAARHKGSPEVAPVYDNGRHVRFAGAPEDLERDIYGRDLGPWGWPRVIYAQHASDPVVWWTTGMVWKEPDWMRERAGRDAWHGMEFTRIATFIQLIVDLPVAGTAPAGHGHTYHDELIPMWQALLGPEALHWVDEDMRRRIAAAISANLALSERGGIKDTLEERRARRKAS